MSDEHCGCYSSYDLEIGVKISRDACKFAAALARAEAAEKLVVGAIKERDALRKLVSQLQEFADEILGELRGEVHGGCSWKHCSIRCNELRELSVPHESPNSHIDSEYTDGDKEHAEE